mgnify:CR=1 FL=1
MQNLTPWEAVSKLLLDAKEYMELGHAERGMTTYEINDFIEKEIEILGATPYNKGYHPKWAPVPYPAASCLCVNEVIVHGIPDNKPLKSGDIVTIDIGILLNGQCGDAALTVMVGEVSDETKRLVECSKQAVFEGIKQVKAGANTIDIAYAIQKYITDQGFAPNRNYGGHGIGAKMHEDPIIFNTLETRNTYTTLTEGQLLCIEVPMSVTDWEGIRLADGWTIAARDGKPASMFEHMIRVTKHGAEILTTHF